MERAAKFIRSQPSKHFDQNEILIYQDEKPKHLFAIRSGFVKIHTISPSGSEQVAWLSKKFEFIPLDLMFDDTKLSPYFYTAFTDVEAFVVDRDAFMAFIREDNEALFGMAAAIAEKYEGLLTHLNALQQSKAPAKILHTLHFIATRFSSDDNNSFEVTLPLTHQDVASLAGLTRETASIELRRLKDDGLIDYTSSSFIIYTDKIDRILRE